MSKTGGGRGTNQYGVKGVSRERRGGGRKDSKVSVGGDDRIGEPDPVEFSWVRGARAGTTEILHGELTHLTPECKWIRKRSQLDLAEGANIAEDAAVWLEVDPPGTPEEILDPEWLKTLHRRMLGRIWTYAGEFRSVRLNLGVPPHMVEQEMRRTLNMARLQIGKRSSIDEIAVRLHLGLVAVHPFMGGNGRHARLVADEMAKVLGEGREFSYTWGAANGKDATEVRSGYMSAVRNGVETNDISRLLKIARS